MDFIKWKYGLILISIEDKDTDYESEICELVELYQDKNGNYTSWCKARINSLEELTNAYNDIQRDGINHWFYKNGFTHEQ